MIHTSYMIRGTHVGHPEPRSAVDVWNRLYVESPEWVESEACSRVDPELFFPEKGGGVREARKICAECPVRIECLAYAIAHDERFGFWGGTSERERRRLNPRRPGRGRAA